MKNAQVAPHQQSLPGIQALSHQHASYTDEHCTRLARLAARLVQAPAAIITLYAPGATLALGSYGLSPHDDEGAVVRTAWGLYQHLSAQHEALVIPDLSMHPLLAGTLAFQRLHIRSCAALPVHAPTGQAAGMLCAFDSKPRTWSRDELTSLSDLANEAASELARRHTGEELRRSEANLVALFENTQDSIWLVDSSLRLITFNGFFREQFHLAFGIELKPGMRIHEHLPQEQYEFWTPLYQRALCGERFSAEFAFDFGGTRRWFDLSFNPIRVDGAITGVSVFSRDVTDRKRAEEERLAMERSWLQTQRLESLGVLAGGIAHDFNNLLAAIMGNANLALAEVTDDSLVWSYLKQIELASQRAAGLTQQMLAYAGKGRVVVQQTDMSALVAELARLLKASLPRPVPISYHLATRLPPIQADVAQMRQVVMNLIINAAEAIDTPDGSITVTTGLRHLRAGEVIAADHRPLPPGAYVFLTVVDTGCGMDEATLARIFEPFFTTKFTGRGLGLAAVQGIVHAHGGALLVQSSPGVGTTFTMLAPSSSSTAAAADDQASSTAQAPQPWGDQRAVLVVDDEVYVRQIVARMLEYAGFQTLMAANGHEALDAFQSSDADIACVLLDWTMPGMRAADVVHSLVEIRPDVRIIVMSGYNEQEVTGEIDARMIAAFLHKPFKQADLLDMVRQVLG